MWDDLTLLPEYVDVVISTWRNALPVWWTVLAIKCTIFPVIIILYCSVFQRPFYMVSWLQFEKYALVFIELNDERNTKGRNI